MSPSGAELIRQIKSQVDEVDPSEVRSHLGNGVVLVDVRESAASGTPGTSPAPGTSRAGTSSRASRAPCRTARSG